MNEFERNINNGESNPEAQKPLTHAENTAANAASSINSTEQENQTAVKAGEKAQVTESAYHSSPLTYGQTGNHSPVQNNGGRVGTQPVGTPPSYSATGAGAVWNGGAQPVRPAPGAPHAYAPQGAVIPPPAPQKKKGNGGKIALVLIAVFVLALAGGFLGAKLTKAGGTGDAVIYQSDTKTSTDTDSTGAAKKTNTVESVAATTAASVVEVKTSYVQKGSFFGDYVTSGAGSGVVISKDGYIVTNNHVIDKAEEITVTLKSGKEYKAKLVGTDDKTDIAVLKIEATDLTPATFGDSGAVAVGEQIVVIGNPLGSLGGSVTTGIISATDREIEVENMTMTLLQVDAAVNPGNSGGALFNLNGELVGVVNAKYSSEEVEGLGFAIPINTAKATIEDIIEYGYVKGRAQLGITAVEISDLQTAISAGVTELGVYVYNVNDGSGADKAGLKAGDRLVKIDDTEINSYAVLSKILSKHSVGDSVSVTYSRNGKQSTVDVKLIEYKPSNTQSSSANG
ncbi:MAG: trypsin-like peptidase domain-containing protein [Clostridia bacterium]|nr:trypsin-like peptidase domain-containing protein [Clostridia bacterium]